MQPRQKMFSIMENNVIKQNINFLKLNNLNTNKKTLF